jgi:hypothetical protein
MTIYLRAMMKPSSEIKQIKPMHSSTPIRSKITAEEKKNDTINIISNPSKGNNISQIM